MIFALVHATLGWALAALASLALRGRSADARGWAWRLGLLKGPLAVLLAVPFVVPGIRSTPIERPAAPVLRQAPPVASAPASASLATRVDEAPVPTPGGISVARMPVSAPAPTAFPTLSVLYGVGFAGVLVARFARRRTIPDSMPRVEGVFRPRVVVPVGLDPERAAMVLAHEEAHVRRRDPLWSFLADLVCAGLWFAPPVWLCAAAMRAEAEAACDAAALDRTGAPRRAYAHLLLDHAGVVPANALGGPARRLARRIRMLERKTKPLSRPSAAGLVVLGLAAALPWRAVAQASPSVAPPHDRLPARTSLEAAGARLLRKPEIRAQLELSPAQEQTLARRTLLGNLRLLAMRKRDALSNLKKFPANSRAPMAQASRIEWANVTRDEAETRRKLAAARITPLSEAQRRKLAALALDRFGSALWEDRTVASALGLTPRQIDAAKAQNDGIESALRADHSSGEFAYRIGQLQSQLRQGNLTPTKRRSLERQIRDEERMADRFRPLYQADAPEFWRMRGAADARLEGGLTPSQRQKLESLRRSADAWPSAPSFLPSTGGEKPNGAPAARHDSGPSIQASHLEKRKGEPAAVLHTSEDVRIGGQRPEALPLYAGSGTLVRTLVFPDGSGWRIYRDDEVKPIPYTADRFARPGQAPKVWSKPQLVALWSGLTIDGPPPGSEPDNVPVGVAHEADGSTYTVYRRSQTAPYLYAIELYSSRPPKWYPERLDYQKIATPEFGRRLRVLGAKLPTTLNVDGEVWTVHPFPKRSTTKPSGAPPSS